MDGDYLGTQTGERITLTVAPGIEEKLRLLRRNYCRPAGYIGLLRMKREAELDYVAAPAFCGDVMKSD